MKAFEEANNDFERRGLFLVNDRERERLHFFRAGMAYAANVAENQADQYADVSYNDACGHIADTIRKEAE